VTPASALAREPSSDRPPFRSTGQILFFYVGEFSRRTGIRVPDCALADMPPMPRMSWQEREDWYAAVVAALHEREPEDYPFDPPLTERRLEALVHWYLTDEPASASRRMISHFADDLGLRSATWPAFCRECHRTRNVFRRRMVARGLVGE
jgi:hypothetical protein